MHVRLGQKGQAGACKSGLTRETMFAIPFMSATARRVLDRRSAMCSIRRVLVLVGFVLAWPVSPLHAQTLPAENQAADDVAVNDNEASTTELDLLVAHALVVHPLIRAAVDRVEAARAAIRPAGARPDPMLMAGVMNLPLSDPGFTDFMTMKTIGIGQVFPYPGKLGLRRRVAELELAASEARLEAVRLAVAEEVKQAYYDLAFLDHALEVLQNNERLLANLIQVTGARYGVGTGGQQDVLKARVEAARLAEEAVALMERRRAALARLNAALYRPSETPVPAPAVPVRIARAAVADDAGEILFTSATLGARAADSPLPPLIELQETAVRQNPMLQVQAMMIAAQAARAELAGKDYLPDFDVSLQYGQRDGRSDMISAIVSVPIPLQKGQKQDLLVKEAEAELSALQAERRAQANEIRSEVAEAYADLERERARLALFVKSIIPQGRASLASATAGFQVGRNDFLTLLENQATLYNYETEYYRSLTEFATRLANLERIVGKEIL